MKPILWVASSKRDLVEMPKDVVADFGYGLYQAQLGEHPDIAKPLKHVGGSVLELVADHKSSTFRAVYTVKFPKAIVVLHAFQKKSKKGIATPKKEVDLIKERLKRAEKIYKDWLTKED